MDNYEKQKMLVDSGYDEEYLETLQGSQLSRLFYDDIGELEMIETVKEKGEDEGDSHRIWLSDLNGACNICDEYTDIMSAVACKNLDGEDSLSIQVNTPDDKRTIFACLDDFDYSVVDKIYEQIMNYKK